ncbi:hypothetical protein B7463_g3868, partial [Scytalidium lignicola]
MKRFRSTKIAGRPKSQYQVPASCQYGLTTLPPEEEEDTPKTQGRLLKILSVLRAIKRSGSGNSQADSGTPDQNWPDKDPSFLTGDGQCDVTIVHRSQFSSRPSIMSTEVVKLEIAEVSPSNSAGESSFNSPRLFPRTPSQSTDKTSFESNISMESTIVSPHSHDDDLSILEPPYLDLGFLLDPRVSLAGDTPSDTRESVFVLDPVRVTTIERAAAAKVFFEYHYNNLTFKQASPRSLRQRQLEELLFKDETFTESEKDEKRRAWAKQQSDHLRAIRVMKARGAKALIGKDEPAAAYEVVKVLGKGSFGVVRLVREKRDKQTSEDTHKKEIYAMKVIRKADMIVPLIASFQDLRNLYLVMDYMPGGDFLGLLIRENVLPELVTRWYIAEMILCIEEAHTLKRIHRDVKPDNFLISASGHLKISDFGLAFDGHWSHDQSYYNNSRYSLLEKLGIKIEGDTLDRKEARKVAAATQVVEAIMRNKERQKMEYPVLPNGETVLDWRNRRCNRNLARSVVGTSQYMAPEVIRGEVYDARCDWWSLGIILFECLYGHTPFLSEDGGRHQTKMNIVQHENTFCFPSKPFVSRRCQDLIGSLIKEKEQRLCSRRYRERESTSHSQHQDYAGHYVYPNDAEDIKSHKWFKGLQWGRLHLTVPPFVPDVKSLEDTRYFDEEPVSDFSESVCSDRGEAGMVEALKPFDEDIQRKAINLIAHPKSSLVLRKAEKEIDALDICDEQKVYLKAFISHYGRKEKKRPRDKLLRDRKVGGKVMEVRKQSAFLGYTYRMNHVGRDRLAKGTPRIPGRNSLGRRRIWHRARLTTVKSPVLIQPGPKRKSNQANPVQHSDILLARCSIHKYLCPSKHHWRATSFRAIGLETASARESRSRPRTGGGAAQQFNEEQ